MNNEEQNRTKDGVVVRAGQRWRDLDRRMNGRIRSVLRVENGRAYIDGYPRRSIAIRRMHKHSTGWELVAND